ncbi:ABC transporter ATP-binding protein [Salinirubellus salinus]|uniref:ABC transporter ATP-binding protein n=1 Tax=Salinirubellus salinus TaxID=1364945 RepID=A0A9E7R2D0_9EURY|nr:ABC transporter ATP-binding protein [Salinirubellus salinus]UWM53365.1 ABC transporter ATP-binding protein [Salinirubellus salinus]
MSEPLLDVSDVSAGYDDMHVIEGADLRVDPGEFIAIVGPNGAGKSTLLRTLVGGTTLYQGTVTYRGDDITWTPRHDIIEDGIGYIPQDEAVFPDLTVWENLRMGGYTSPDGFEARLAEVYDLFPRLEERETQRADSLSGGESRMLAVARALMPDPELLLVDEPSAGLAPQIVERMFDKLEEIHEDGTSVLLVEQNVDAALGAADRIYTLEGGEIDDRGTTDQFSDSDAAERLGW